METLRSKSFVSSLVMTLIMVLVSLVPALESVQNELVASFTTIAITLVVGHKSKDVLVAIGSRESASEETA